MLESSYWFYDFNGAFNDNWGLFIREMRQKTIIAILKEIDSRSYN